MPQTSNPSRSPRAADSGVATERPLRVVRVIDRLNIGGPAKHVVWLTAGLSQERFDTTLITGIVPPGEGDMSYFARDAGVTPIVIDEMSRELSAADGIVVLKILRQLWRLKPDIVHTHKAKAGATGRIAALIYRWATPSGLWLHPRRCRVVHTYHGHIFHSYFGPLKARLFLAVERTLARLATDCIVVISERQLDEICGRFGVGRRDQFRVIPLGLDCDATMRSDGRLRAMLDLPADALLVGIVGRLSEIKNHALFLDVAALIARQNERARFVIIGDGHLRTPLEERMRGMGLAGRVIFTGFREDALQLYGDLDVVALTSLNEGTPLTLLEAMSAQRAVVATEVGGVPDIMGGRRDGADGYVCWDHGVTAASGDAGAFARGLNYLLTNAEVRSAMGRRGATFVRSRLSRERLLSNVTRLYGDLQSRGARALEM